MHYALFYLFAIGWSPIFLGALNLSPLIVYLPALFGLGLHLLLRNGISRAELFFTATICALIYLGLLLTQATSYFIFYLTLPVVTYICHTVARTDEAAIRRMTKALSAFAIAGIVLSWLGFFYALNGGEALYYFNNPDGRPNGLLLTTFTNSQYGKIIRPSFIYDEPGALSFVICTTAILREALRFPRAQTTLILATGAITFSISHFLILAVYLAWTNRKAALITTAAIIVLVAGTINNEELSFFYDRFSVEDNKLAGDNRSAQLENFQRIATPEIIAFGNYRCHDRQNRVCEEHGDISSSPITPLYLGGALLLAIQCMVHIAIAWAAYINRRLRMPAICLTLLILQRPFFLGYGYQIMIFTTTFLLVFLSRARSHPGPAATAMSSAYVGEPNRTLRPDR